MNYVRIAGVQIGTLNLAEFQQEAEQFIQGLVPRRDGATVVGLYGNLGSGKTTFTQAAAKSLGISETVNSPTFLIFKKYQLPVTSSSYQFLIHVDAYRLKIGDELRTLRFDELLCDPANLIFVEWADKVADVLPRDHIKISFEFIDEHTRKVTIQK